MVLYEVKITQRADAVSTMYGCNAPEGDDAAAYHQTNGTFHYTFHLLMPLKSTVETYLRRAIIIVLVNPPAKGGTTALRQ